MNRLIFVLALLAQACGGPADGPATGLDPSDDAGAGGGDETAPTGQPDPTTGPGGEAGAAGVGGAGGQVDPGGAGGQAGQGGSDVPPDACQPDPLPAPGDNCIVSDPGICEPPYAPTSCPMPVAHYYCPDGQAPPVQGCVVANQKNGWVGTYGTNDYCCDERLCVRYSPNDSFCSQYGLSLGYSCPDDLAGLPDGCVDKDQGPGHIWCCP